MTHLFRTRPVSLILAALATATTAIAQQAAPPPFAYTLLPSAGPGPGPAPRIDGTIAYDPAGRRVFLFGGSAEGDRNDLWTYSLTQRRWTELQPEGDKPPARLGHTLIFDSQRARLVVFGGQSGGFFNDTWSYDIAGNRWSQVAASGPTPSRRYGHSAIYDAPRDRMIISHGFTNSGRFDDTWALDLANGVWRDISPPGNRPLRRCLHHAVHDPANNQMLLYGGCASGFGPCPLGDLWAFDLSAQRWTEITSSSSVKPPAREHYGVAYDTVRERLLLFGGAGPSKLGDTWEFDPRARAWRELRLEGPGPSARSRHESAYAADRGVAFFFGGSTAAAPTNELWMLGPGFQAASRPELSRSGLVNAFSGSGGALAPGEIVSLFGTGLGPLDGVALSLDPITGRLPVSGPGVTVTFNGIAAPLLYVSSSQLNVQAPYEIAGSAEAAIVVTVNGASSEAIALPVQATRPGLFPRAFHASGAAVSDENPATPGETVAFFATGQGLTVPASPTGAIPASGVYPEPAAPVMLLIGGEPAEVAFRGQAPGTVGVMQLNARIPSTLATTGGRRTVPVLLRVGAAASQPGLEIPLR